jgi:hypothetical protein
MTVWRALGTAVYVSNDSIVVNPQAVEDYYAAVAGLLTGEGFEPALYGQASLFAALQQYGYAKVLWKAPDGTGTAERDRDGPASQSATGG